MRRWRRSLKLPVYNARAHTQNAHGCVFRSLSTQTRIFLSFRGRGGEQRDSLPMAACVKTVLLKLTCSTPASERALATPWVASRTGERGAYSPRRGCPVLGAVRRRRSPPRKKPWRGRSLPASRPATQRTSSAGRSPPRGSGCNAYTPCSGPSSWPAWYAA